MALLAACPAAAFPIVSEPRAGKMLEVAAALVFLPELAAGLALKLELRLELRLELE